MIGMTFAILASAMRWTASLGLYAGFVELGTAKARSLACANASLVRVEIASRSRSHMAAKIWITNGSASAPNSATINLAFCAISELMKATSRDSLSSFATMTAQCRRRASSSATANWGLKPTPFQFGTPIEVRLPVLTSRDCSVACRTSMRPRRKSSRQVEGVREDLAIVTPIANAVEHCEPVAGNCVFLVKRPELTKQVIAAITQQRRFPDPFVHEIEERFGDCLDTDYSAGRRNGMSGILAGKQPNEGERVHRGERAPRCGLDCRPNVRTERNR